MDVMTVRGPVGGEDLGITLMHEHLLVDIYRVFQPHREMILNDVELASSELTLYAKAGGRTLVEVTTPDLSRDPAGLRAIAQRTGVNVVMSTGRYREPFYEHELWELTADEIADLFIHEIEVGVDGIRAGIIGEIGVHGRRISPVEERVHRAAARAHKRTGVAITTHANATPVGLAQLDLFEEEGVDLRRVVIGHCDTWPKLDYHEAILKRGAFVEFDTIRGNWEFDTQRQLSQLLHHIEAGRIGQMLLSQDTAVDKFYTVYGGKGYAFLVTEFVARMRAAGLAQEQIDTLLVANPRRALTGTP